MKLTLTHEGLPLAAGDPLVLSPKERLILARLIVGAPDFVDKEELFNAAWPDRPASDESLARCISQLRRRLPGAQIESQYGQGYRLASNVLNVDPHLCLAARAPAPMLHTYLYASRLLEAGSPEATRLAIDTLKHLVDEQPAYASAHVLLAAAVATHLAWGSSSAEHAQAEMALHHVDIANALDPDCPGGMTCRAWVLDILWRFAEAAPLHRKALKKAPNDALALCRFAWHLQACGDAPQAVALLQQAQALQPYSARIACRLAYALLQAGREAAALEWAARAVAVYPANPSAEWFDLRLRLHLRPEPGQLPAARRLCEQRDAKLMFGALLAYALARHGRTDQAREITQEALAAIDRPSTEHLHYLAPLIELGEDAAAALLVERACAMGYGQLPVLLKDPLCRGLERFPGVARVADALQSRALRR